ncbi:hypothetical protein GYB22_03975 [bacterium]|nr:hypothetical protein [bacterium]
MSQGNDEELAAQYFSNGEFDKAATLYKKIHRDKPGSIYIYENYLSSLIALEEEKEAIKLVERQIKRYPRAFNYEVDLGYVYLIFERDEDAQEHYDDLIKLYSKDRNTAYALAQAFQKRQYTQWAIKCYEEAVKHLGPAYFWQHLMVLYRITGETEKLTEMGLEVLRDQPSNIDMVMRLFGNALEEEESSIIVQKQVLLYTQKYPNQTVFDELLMRIYIQQKKYKAAYNQVYAMDKRNREDGRRFLELAYQCISNKEYEVAEMCYRAILEKGQGNFLYVEGEEGLLRTLYLKITEAYEPDSAGVVNLIKEFEAFVKKYGYSARTASSAKRLAELQLFYANDTRRSIEILERLIAIAQLNPNFRGECKLLLADAYLIQGEIWEAKLLYGQVDKEFKEDPLGQEAKFRAARLSYFTGDFDWARDQLDILKTATTQLISNNAIELSLLIQDNTGLDSTEDAMKEYARAQFLLFQNKPDECLQILNMLPFKFPDHSLEDEIYYLKARVMAKKGMFDKALKFYAMVYDNYPYDILADNALFNAAEIQEHVNKNSSEAKSLYERIIIDYTSSLYVIEARKRYNELGNSPTP